MGVVSLLARLTGGFSSLVAKGRPGGGQIGRGRARAPVCHREPAACRRSLMVSLAGCPSWTVFENRSASHITHELANILISGRTWEPISEVRRASSWHIGALIVGAFRHPSSCRSALFTHWSVGSPMTLIALNIAAAAISLHCSRVLLLCQSRSAGEVNARSRDPITAVTFKLIIWSA
jgi:hypothetical protein